MRVVFIILFLIAAPVISLADTTDYYRVFFHGQQIASYSEGRTIKVLLRADSITTFDTMKVDVFRDAPCSSGCSYSMLIFGGNGPVLVDTLQNGEDFYVPLLPLVEHYRKTKANVFRGYYTEFFDGTNRSRVISFEIRLQ